MRIVKMDRMNTMAVVSFAIRALGISNYIPCFLWYVTIHPCTNFNSGLGRPPLKFGHGRSITFHFLCCRITNRCPNFKSGLVIIY